MTLWFRPVYPRANVFELWLSVWHWIGQAHVEEFYPDADRLRRFRESVRGS